MAPAILIAQAIGRFGNFVNAEAHGGVTDLPWRMSIGTICYHPTFLYESIGLIIIFALKLFIKFS